MDFYHSSISGKNNQTWAVFTNTLLMAWGEFFYFGNRNWRVCKCIHTHRYIYIWWSQKLKFYKALKNYAFTVVKATGNRMLTLYSLDAKKFESILVLRCLFQALALVWPLVAHPGFENWQILLRKEVHWRRSQESPSEAGLRWGPRVSATLTRHLKFFLISVAHFSNGQPGRMVLPLSGRLMSAPEGWLVCI